LRCTIPRWISTAQRNASTALTNRTNKPSPVVFMMPAVLGKLGRNELGMMRVELGEGAFLIHADQAAVAGYIRD
jgi:hypothetical protein